jgi:hypothetical protein
MEFIFSTLSKNKIKKEFNKKFQLFIPTFKLKKKLKKGIYYLIIKEQKIKKKLTTFIQSFKNKTKIKNNSNNIHTISKRRLIDFSI